MEANTTERQRKLPIVQRDTVGGAVLSCGTGDFGQLGLGEQVTEKTRPAKVPNVPHAVDVCAGGMHSLVLTDTGKLYSFGCNDEFALGRPTTDEFAAGLVKLPAKVVKISAGDSHSACLLEDGRVFAWGSFRDSHGSMGLTVNGRKDTPIELLKLKFVDIASGTDHLVLLAGTGEVFTVGCGEQGQLGRISSRSMSSVSRHGQSSMLQPTSLNLRKRADAIWASAYCTFFRERNTDNIYAVGLNNYNQLNMTDKADMQLRLAKTQFSNILKIAGGQHHTLALTKDHKCYVIGRQNYGRLGLGEIENDVDELTVVGDLVKEEIVDIACGDVNSFAVTKDGRVFAWGLGSNNQLGIGSEDDAFSPVLLTGLQVKDKKVLKVSGGGQHTLFIVKEPKPVGESSDDEGDTVKSTNGATEKTTPTTKGKGAKRAESSKSIDSDLDATEPVATKKKKSETKSKSKPKKMKAVAEEDDETPDEDQENIPEDDDVEETPPPKAKGKATTSKAVREPISTSTPKEVAPKASKGKATKSKVETSEPMQEENAPKKVTPERKRRAKNDEAPAEESASVPKIASRRKKA